MDVNKQRQADRRRLLLMAVHMPGKNNVIAHETSRQSSGGGYGLKNKVLQQLQLEWGVKITAASRSPPLLTEMAVRIKVLEEAETMLEKGKRS
jgi:hypothetical protein